MTMEQRACVETLKIKKFKAPHICKDDSEPFSHTDTQAHKCQMFFYYLIFSLYFKHDLQDYVIAVASMYVPIVVATFSWPVHIPILYIFNQLSSLK